MTEPRIREEIQLLEAILSQRGTDIAHIILEADDIGEFDNDAVVQPVVEHILDYLSNLDRDQLDELYEMYVLEDLD